MRFTYRDLDIDERAGVVACHYDLDGHRYVETVDVGPGHTWGDAAREAARLVHLLAGVSYYKAGAARVIDLGDVAVRPGERAFLRRFYLDGLGEFAYRNGLDLHDVEVVGGREGPSPITTDLDPARPLIPFGGGIDSLVTVHATTATHPDAALFVVNRRGVRFEAIERAADAVALPVVHVERELDPQILRPADPAAVFNGHVPITGVLSAIAVLVAVLEGRGLVVMSNEWSASRGNVVAGGREVNHQFSKSEAFEEAFRSVVTAALRPGPDYFSFLRPFSELWVARRFAGLERFHGVVHSCNRAFALDPDKRLDRWCGRCDKCCFIDLILAPFLEPERLAGIFGGTEPLDDESLLPQFRVLLGLGAGIKPFECVGDVDECRTAAALAHQRPDRAGNPVLAALADELGVGAVAARDDADRLLRPLSAHHIPDALLPAAALG